MNKNEQQRLVRWRVKVIRHVIEVTQNVSKTCRYFGISRPTFYKWKTRFDAHGETGLCDRTKRPRKCPHAISKDVVSKILYMRQTYHFGPAKISYYLDRYHQIRVAHSSVHRILQRHGMNRLPSSQKHRTHKHRWKRYEN